MLIPRTDATTALSVVRNSSCCDISAAQLTVLWTDNLTTTGTGTTGAPLELGEGVRVGDTDGVGEFDGVPEWLGVVDGVGDEVGELEGDTDLEGVPDDVAEFDGVPDGVVGGLAELDGVLDAVPPGLREGDDDTVVDEVGDQLGDDVLLTVLVVDEVGDRLIELVGDWLGFGNEVLDAVGKIGRSYFSFVRHSSVGSTHVMLPVIDGSVSTSPFVVHVSGSRAAPVWSLPRLMMYV